MLYGCEVTPLSNADIKRAQQVHNEAARTILGVPYTGIASWLCTQELGWMRIQALIDKRTLNFLGNIHLNHSLLPKLSLKYCMENNTDYQYLKYHGT